MRRKRSISFPIVSASITVALAISLLVGWTLVMVQNMSLTQKVAENVTVLVLGLLSLLAIIVVVILFSIFLVRRIREINRQYTFIDSVSHELKTPLASLRLAVETLARPGLPETSRDELRHMMLGDISRLNLFIDDILAASRLSYQHTQKELQEVELWSLIDTVIKVCRSRHGLGETTLTLEGKAPTVIDSDPVGLTTVFTNLLENAIKYSTRSNGEIPPIKVRLTQSEKWVSVSVADQGIGIEQKYHKKVFNRFFRIPSEEVRKRHGTGLGLFVAAEVSRSLGGRIRAESNPDGVGSLLTVMLPARQEEE
jgi:signal transduction histidine kinase